MKENLLREMGKRISGQRKLLGLTQEEIAEKLDVSVQFISYIERGQKGISLENLIKLSKELNISCDYILMGKRNENDTADLFSKIVAFLCKLCYNYQW